MERIRLEHIAFDAGTQIREAISEQVVTDYAERMADGVEFPPVVLFADGCCRTDGKTNEKELAARLAATPHGVRGLLRRVESQRERTGNQKSQCVAATVVDIYNKPLGPRSGERLPDWWKSAQ